MPYMMMGKCVHKQNEDGSAGEVVKCHDTAEQAKAHMAALYANVEDAATKEILPEGISAADLLQAVEDSLTAEETQAIDRLYQDVASGKIALESLPDPDAATGKAVNNLPRGGNSGACLFPFLSAAT